MTKLFVPPTEEATPTPTYDLRRIGVDPNHWWPVAWSREVKAGAAFPASFAGEPIAIIRSPDGTAFALEDRCAHRQVPLSKGVVTNEGVRCCYHGWHYNRAGRCIELPYKNIEATSSVRSYPCHEAAGMIFVWPGDAPPLPFPATIGSAQDSAYKTRRFGRSTNCHYSFMHENLMDMHHQFLHRRTTGKVTPRYVAKRTGEDWIEVDYAFKRPDDKPPIGETIIVGALRGSSSKAQDLMTIRTEYPHQSLKFWTSGDRPALHVWLAYTPIDRAQKTNRSFILLSVQRPKIPFLLDLGWPVLKWFTDKVFDEDQVIVEMEQAAWDAQGCDLNQEVFAPILELRTLLFEKGRPIAD